ncbi:hypothetical protein DH2020_023600 [Rehmannia glutinosa]|uniref:Amidohydrolase 3 domain-containing protein n=1 Tax=Rehmannia glutinosa TaxID=99300 RepID=A0ABR0W6I7_REHGL
MARVQLRGVSRKDHFVNKVKEALSNMQPGSWLLGGGWNNDFWGGELPMASWIDAITPHNPVWLTRMDGHMGLANSLALNVAGISNNTVDPEGGSVVRNSVGDVSNFCTVVEIDFQFTLKKTEVALSTSYVTFFFSHICVSFALEKRTKNILIDSLISMSSLAEPTGLLIDSAMTHVLSCIPEVSVEERREALLRASDHALMRGVTTVVDFGRYFPGASPELSWEDLSDVYRWADLSGKMKIRVCLYFPMETWPRLHELIKQAGRKLSQWIYLGGMKSFADGSLGSNSALFHEPYVDEPSNHGLQVADTDMLYNMTLSSDKAGLQVAIHAIGDRANDLILDLYKSVASKNGVRDRRFRIEHAQHLAPGTAARFGEQEVVASVQSNSEMGVQWISPHTTADLFLGNFGGIINTKGRVLWNAIGHAMYWDLSSCFTEGGFFLEYARPNLCLVSGFKDVALGPSPDHLLDDADSATKKLGVGRAHGGSYLFHSLLAGNAQLALGSDWPVADINPLGSIKTAMKRVPPGWENAWISSECINLNDALNG